MKYVKYNVSEWNVTLISKLSIPLYIHVNKIFIIFMCMHTGNVKKTGVHGEKQWQSACDQVLHPQRDVSDTRSSPQHPIISAMVPGSFSHYTTSTKQHATLTVHWRGSWLCSTVDFGCERCHSWHSPACPARCQHSRGTSSCHYLMLCTRFQKNSR